VGGDTLPLLRDVKNPKLPEGFRLMGVVSVGLRWLVMLVALLVLTAEAPGFLQGFFAVMLIIWIAAGGSEARRRSVARRPVTVSARLPSPLPRPVVRPRCAHTDVVEVFAEFAEPKELVRLLCLGCGRGLPVDTVRGAPGCSHDRTLLIDLCTLIDHGMKLPAGALCPCSKCEDLRRICGFGPSLN
jgi:hypothetical protein